MDEGLTERLREIVITANDEHSPRAAARALETDPSLPDAPDRERLRGYAVTGVPFASGHILAMRRFPATSLGPAYTSVWHGTPEGHWTIYQDQPPQFSCPRAFGPAIDETPVVPIGLDWTGPDDLDITIDTDDVQLRWHIRLESTSITRAINAAARVLPSALRRNSLFLAVVGRATGPLLRAGRVRLTGRVPSGKHFVADLHKIWLTGSSAAMLNGTDLGPPAPLDDQTNLGDFWVTQRGIFAIADALFEPMAPSETPQLTRTTDTTTRPR